MFFKFFFLLPKSQNLQLCNSCKQTIVIDLNEMMHAVDAANWQVEHDGGTASDGIHIDDVHFAQLVDQVWHVVVHEVRIICQRRPHQVHHWVGVEESYNLCYYVCMSSHSYSTTRNCTRPIASICVYNVNSEN